MPLTKEELEYYRDPEVWPEFMRSALMPAPPRHAPGRTATAAPVNARKASGFGGLQGQILPPRMPTSAPALGSSVSLFSAMPSAPPVQHMESADSWGAAPNAAGAPLPSLYLSPPSPMSPSESAISAFPRVHSPSKTGVNALMDALWPNADGAATAAPVNPRKPGGFGGLQGQILPPRMPTPAPGPHSSVSLFSAMPSAPPVQHMESADYWGAAPNAAGAPLPNPYLSPMPAMPPMPPAPSAPPVQPEVWSLLAGLGRAANPLIDLYASGALEMRQPMQWPDPPPSRADAAYQQSLDRWRAIRDYFREDPSGFSFDPRVRQVLDRLPPLGKLGRSITEQIIESQPWRTITDFDWSAFGAHTLGDRAATDRQIAAAMPLAMQAMGGGVMVAPKNAAGLFGGRLSPGADQAALARAQQMARRGASREEILAETNWFKDGEGNWLYEISDHKARFVGPYDKQPERDLGRVIKHDDLFEARPDLAQVQMGTTVRKGQPAEGSYEAGPRGERIKITAPGRREAISATLHEIQHAMNRREGFPTGVTPKETLSPEAFAELTSKRQALDDLWSEANHPANAGWTDGLTRSPTGEISGQPTGVMGQIMLQLQQRINQLKRDAYEGYRMQPSEVMSRNVQTRRTMTPVERLRYPPWETEGKWGLTTADEFPFIRGRMSD